MGSRNKTTTTEVGAFTRHMEEQAWVAWREWPQFLALREAKLRQLIEGEHKPLSGPTEKLTTNG